VQEVTADRFGARLIKLDRHTPDRYAPELWAEFDLVHLPDAEPGVLFNLYVHRRGKKVRTVLRRRDLGIWAQEEIEAIRTEARRLARSLTEEHADA
jgi:hypothetical protein